MSRSNRHRQSNESLANIDSHYVDFRTGNCVVLWYYWSYGAEYYPYSHAVYASQYALPHTTQNSLPVLRLTTYRVNVSCPLCEAPFRAHYLTPRWGRVDGGIAPSAPHRIPDLRLSRIRLFTRLID